MNNFVAAQINDPMAPYLAECPGMSALPSLPTVRGPLDTHSDKSQTLLHVPGISFDGQKIPFFDAGHVKVFQHQ